MVLNPKEPLFYKALGMAQARLDRYAKALATLEAGLHRAPQDGEFGKLIEAVKAMTADGRRSKCGVRTARGQTADG
jgi:hypothetical protein